MAVDKGSECCASVGSRGRAPGGGEGAKLPEAGEVLLSEKLTFALK